MLAPSDGGLNYNQNLKRRWALHYSKVVRTQAVLAHHSLIQGHIQFHQLKKRNKLVKGLLVKLYIRTLSSKDLYYKPELVFRSWRMLICCRVRWLVAAYADWFSVTRNLGGKLSELVKMKIKTDYELFVGNVRTITCRKWMPNECKHEAKPRSSEVR